jgi:hypothetical protein
LLRTRGSSATTPPEPAPPLLPPVAPVLLPPPAPA